MLNNEKKKLNNVIHKDRSQCAQYIYIYKYGKSVNLSKTTNDSLSK